MFDSFAILWTVACQALLSMGFPRQEYWSRLPFLSPRDLSDLAIEPGSLALTGGLFTTAPPGKPLLKVNFHLWLLQNIGYVPCAFHSFVAFVWIPHIGDFIQHFSLSV